MADLGIWKGHSVQQKDGRTLIFAPDGSVFHDFGKNVDAEVYEEVIRAWKVGFSAGMTHGGEVASHSIRNTIKRALGLD